jgi:hypothetical protein
MGVPDQTRTGQFENEKANLGKIGFIRLKLMQKKGRGERI